MCEEQRFEDRIAYLKQRVESIRGHHTLLFNWICVLICVLTIGIFGIKGDDFRTFVVGGVLFLTTLCAMQFNNVKAARVAYEANILYINFYSGEYFLLLRSFRSVMWSVERLSGRGAHRTDSLLNDLLDAVDQRGPLIIIGTHLGLSEVGLMQLQLSVEWRAVVEVLADSAKLVLLIPDGTDGVIEEAFLLSARKWFEKAIVVIPPPNLRDRHGKKSHWDSVRNAFADRGLLLPKFSPKGLVYLPDRNLSVRRLLPLNWDSPQEEFRKELSAILASLPPGKGLAEVANHLSLRLEEPRWH